MTSYLNKSFDWRTTRVANAYDELPLWSANFGQLLLENVPMEAYGEVLDVGFGSGFPAIELAQRFGASCKVTGVDPWVEAGTRALEKMSVFQIENVEILSKYDSLSQFNENRFDLIVSNLGINNFENPVEVLKDCHRVLKPGSLLCTTSNLTGTFDEYYGCFEKTLSEGDFGNYQSALQEHIAQRGTEESVTQKMEVAGFKINRIVRNSFSMRFRDGTAFLNHSFIVMAFLASWKNIVAPIDRIPVFELLEQNLNLLAAEQGELKLTVPMTYFEARK